MFNVRRPTIRIRRGRKSLLQRIVGVSLAIVVGCLAAGLAFFGVAALTDRPELFSFTALGVLALVTTAGIHTVTRDLEPSEQRDARARITGITLLVIAFLVMVTIFWPLQDRYQPPPRLTGQSTWNLSTGSRISYVKLSAKGPARPTPIIFLHGGPGASELSEAADFFGQLTSDGYDVYMYDQIGTGRSMRLEDPNEYTVARNVADLEAIRAQIGADQVILIGHSWGSTLAAAYLAEYAAHVAKVVFSSPDAMWLQQSNTNQFPVVSRLTSDQRGLFNDLLYQPRMFTIQLLTKVNPRAAHGFASDTEVDARFNRILAASEHGMFCTATSAPIPQQGGGFYAYQLVSSDRHAVNPTAALRALAIPALILKGACDYLPWSFAIGYRDTIPNAVLVYLADAGHQAYVEQPAAYLAALRAFLLDPSSLVPYTQAEPPADYQGPISLGGDS